VGFVLLALLFLALKALDVGFVANLAWSWVWLPLGAAVVWWHFADKWGYTQKKAMQRMDEKKEERRQRQLVAMGRNDPGKGKR
jgi:small Trp-rich protein